MIKTGLLTRCQANALQVPFDAQTRYKVIVSLVVLYLLLLRQMGRLLDIIRIAPDLFIRHMQWAEIITILLENGARSIPKATLALVHVKPVDMRCKT